ncbi:restriction endonuclease subunit S [Sulfurimonas sp.]
MSELYELPEGWKWKQLCDISKLIGGGTPKRNMNEYWDNGNIVWLSPTDLGKIGDIIYISDSKDKITQLGLDKSSAKLLPVGTVLYSSRATIGKIAINTIEVSTNQGFTNFICNENLNNRYLAYILSRFTPEITSLSNSTTFKEVSKTSLKKFQIPLPPLQEQKRIVSKLDTLFEKIDKAIALHQKNMDEADVFMRSVLNEVFGELEEKYEKTSLDDIADIIDGDRGKNYPKKSDFNEEDGYCLFLNAKNVTKNGFRFNQKQFISKQRDELLGKGKVSREDLIITTRGTIGNISIYDKSVEYKNVRINSGMAIIRIKNEKTLYNRFLYKYLYSPQFLNYLSDVQSGSAQPQITIKNLKESSFSIPPLNIQQKTVNYLDQISQKIEKLKAVQKEKMESLVALKASILDQAFRGEL